MKKGKHICETLKAIRRDIAQANDIDYNPEPCNYEGDCDGTCPRCESEVRWLERQLLLRKSLGKAITIAGLTVATSTLATSCNVFQPNGQVIRGKSTNVDTTEHVLEGDVMMMPDSASVCDKPDTVVVDSDAPADIDNDN